VLGIPVAQGGEQLTGLEAPPRYRMLGTQRNDATHLLRRSGDIALAQRDHACVLESVLRGAGRQIWVLPGSVGTLFRLLDLTYELRQRATAVSAETLATVAPEVQMR
jgi:hypothetical protein